MSRDTDIQDVVEAYVADVVRRLPRKDRNEIGLELRGLLAEMLAARAEEEGRRADDGMVLAMLRAFGTPAEVAARYRPPGMLIIPAEHTKTFALLALGGIGLQWALTLPAVFEGRLPPVGWWFGWGLGAFWWPGFMVVAALVEAWLRQLGVVKPRWRPRIVDPDRVNRGALAFGLAWGVVGAGFMTALPWLVGRLPGPFPEVFAFDATFLQARAWPVLLLWLGAFATMAVVLAHGQRTALTRRLETGFSLAFVALLGWWLVAGDIFRAKATDEGAKAALALVICFLLVDLAYGLFRRRPRITPIKPTAPIAPIGPAGGTRPPASAG